MRELSSNGKRPVYWVPPPTARDPKFNEIYATQNKAVEQAAAAVDGARYVDIYNTINHGRYSDELKIDGRACSPANPTACTSHVKAPSFRRALSCARWPRTTGC